jgi:hypothetical protein
MARVTDWLQNCAREQQYDSRPEARREKAV